MVPDTASYLPEPVSTIYDWIPENSTEQSMQLMKYIEYDFKWSMRL